MTTGENTDSLDNVIVTSDEAFERVTSDIKEEYTESDGSLKQNTSGLVQEIPNISFLDIADTLLENKKTLHNRGNWNVIVGSEGKSIEVVPVEIALLHGGSQSTNYSGAVDNINPITSIVGPSDPDDYSSYEIVTGGSSLYFEIKREGFFMFRYTGTVHSTSVTNGASNILEYGFNVEMPDGTSFIANTQTTSTGYRYYEAINNEYCSYCMKGEKIGVYINRSSGTWQLYNFNLYVQYLSNTN